MTEICDEASNSQRFSDAVTAGRPAPDQGVTHACTDLAVPSAPDPDLLMEDHSQRADRELACLYRLSRQLEKSLEPESVANIALQTVLEAVQPDVVLLFLKEGEQLALKGQLNRMAQLPVIDLPMHTVGECLCGRAVSEARPIYVLNILDDPRCTMNACRQAGVVSFAALPLHHEKGILGVLAMASQSQARDFSVQAQFLETVVAQVAVALQYARLHSEIQSHSAVLAQTVEELEREIAERESAQQAFRRSAARLESIFRAAPIGIGLVMNRTLLEVNDRICLMTGRTKQELIGQNALILYPTSADYEFVGREKYRQIDAQGIGTVETRWRQKDGTVIDVLLSSVPLNAQDLAAGVTFSALDITDRKVAINEIRKLNSELEQRVAVRTAELAMKNRELETFTYSVSHDLKAPLRAIDGYSRLLLDNYASDLDDEAALFLQYIRNGTDQMNRLIDGLLAYSRLELRSPSNRTIDLRTLLEDIVAKHQAEIASRHVLVSMDVAELKVVADAEGLSAALRNLVDNAFKFTLKSPRPTIVIGGRPSPDGILIWVRDNGKGFDMRYHDRIFDIFQRLDRLEEYPGTGIGLSMVRKASERMGGRCWAQSEPDRGATFYLEVPQ